MSGGRAVRTAAGERGISRLGRKRSGRKVGNARAVPAASSEGLGLDGPGAAGPLFSSWDKGAQRARGQTAFSRLRQFKRNPRAALIKSGEAHAIKAPATPASMFSLREGSKPSGGDGCWLRAKP